MTFWKKIARSNFSIKLRNWEYWPFGIVQLPSIIYYLWLSLRSRSFFFFSGANPGIVMGGMFGESKYEVLKKIPETYTPKTILIEQPATSAEVLAKLLYHGFRLPVIFKPDIGERGFMVSRIRTEQDIERYLQTMKFNFLVQELVDLPLEFGVFYVRYPHQKTGKVTSIVKKEMLSVTGDGRTTLQDLILAKDRAKLQWGNLQQTFQDQLHQVVPEAKTIELVSIGNHCLGTKFLNGNHLINEKLCSTFDRISHQVEGFYYGRFDLRCASVEALYEGQIKIMELNGCGAEPAHIYQPGYPLRKAIGVMLSHWKSIFIIASENANKGMAFTSYKEASYHYKNFKKATQVNH